MARSFLSEGVSPSARALDGVVLDSGSAVRVHHDPVYAFARTPAPGRVVALVSGGGAGHEPMHASFVGQGGLDAACPGEIFTSPHNRQIHAAGARVALPGGVLHLVKNYTGDRINFAIAAERLRAEGHRVTELLIDDDLGSDGSDVGRRGTGATVVVEKILGAAADTGLGLDALADLGGRVVANSRSLAVANGAHTAPGGDGGPAFDLPAGQLEYGVGIHGEAGSDTFAQPALDALVGRMVERLLAALPTAPAGYLLLVNGLGGVSNLELLHVLAAASDQLAARGVRLRSAHSGTWASALDMRGFSLTLTALEEEWLTHWLAPHGTAGLPTPRALPEPAPAEAADDAPAAAETPAPSAWLAELAALFADRRAAFNTLDQRTGDGDLGTNLAGGMAAAVRRARAAEPTLADDLTAVAGAFLDDVGGSSGPLFGLLFQQLAGALTVPGEATEAARLAEGLRAGLAAVSRVGGAQPGDRTLLDALHPAAFDGDAPRGHLDEAAVAAALAGAAATRDLVARRGRASYLGERVLGTPDPGAVALAGVLLALLERHDGEPKPALRADLEELTR